VGSEGSCWARALSRLLTGRAPASPQDPDACLLRGYSPSADMWSVGVILYYLLAGGSETCTGLPMKVMPVFAACW
jgi:serine/threonine protein kinase